MTFSLEVGRICLDGIYGLCQCENTHVCAATSLLVWLFLDMIFFGKPSVIGVVQGMITGLVCITPAAGVVQGWAAILMGVLSGSVPWYTMMVLHKRIPLLKQVNDTMAVFHTHSVAGSLGGILTGFFAEPKLNRLFYAVDDWPKYIGLAYGFQIGRTTAGLRQMGVQLGGILSIAVLNIVSTSLICLLIRLIVPLRLSEEVLEVGDDAIHGEEAYALWRDGEMFQHTKHNSVYLLCLLIRLIVPLRLSEEVLEVGDDAIHGEEAYALWRDGEMFQHTKHNSVYDIEYSSSTMQRTSETGNTSPNSCKDPCNKMVDT